MTTLARFAVEVNAMLMAGVLLSTHCVAAEQKTAERPRPAVQSLDDQLHHIRNGSDPEWDDFDTMPESESYSLTFESTVNDEALTLQITQHNVKQSWQIELNGKNLGLLHTDENPIVGLWSVPAGTLRDGSSKLLISTTSSSSDDVRIGHVVLHRASRAEVLNKTKVSVTVSDQSTGEPVPCRITILNNEQLMTVGAESSDDQAVRPGVIYCRGTAQFGLPAGDYTLIAGRGPEYSIAETTIHAGDQESINVALAIRREVATPGLVSCDTHVHTLTHSGHGDASISERMLTLAGECIELPIATDHNKHIDYVPSAAQLRVARFFTPVIGNEVTTKIGHFNVFPIAATNTPIPDFEASDWPTIFKSIHKTPNVRAVILNHARDIHSGYRPFGPEHHLGLTGQNLDGWKLEANAMEIINSGAQQTDMMQLVHDWMGMLNAGHQLTPVGSSDSHDVARFIVGQGRTYITCEDQDVSRIDSEMAITNFVAGKVIVSCGLLCNLHINGQSGPGDTAPQASSYTATVDVMGPSWIQASELEIFANGLSVFREEIPVVARAAAGLKHTFVVPLSLPKNQDVFIVAVARGPGVRRLHWPVARPYQPTSTSWEPICMSITGAVWIDADGDGVYTSARPHAQRLCEGATNDFATVVRELSRYDAAVATHAASLLLAPDSPSPTDSQRTALQTAAPQVREAFEQYMLEWRQSQIHRAAGQAQPSIGK